MLFCVCGRAQGGDFTRGNGTGGESIFGPSFDDEFVDDVMICHSSPYLLSMANAGKNTNGSQFFITFKPVEYLDGKHVVFGKVDCGEDVLREIESVGSPSGKPKQQVLIVACGEIKTNCK